MNFAFPRGLGLVLRRSLLAAAVMAPVTLTYAAVPGIVGPAFALSAAETYSSQPDGAQIYSWGYGCTPGSTPTMQAFAHSWSGARCAGAQLPGPTLIVNEGDAVTVTLTNNLPAAAGNTSILFPGFAVTASGGTPGMLAAEARSTTCNPGAKPGCNTVTYQFTASRPGTYAYYSGTQPNLQVEMGMFGAIIVKPSAVPTSCRKTGTTPAGVAGETDARLAASAFDHPDTCYDREYLFQFSEMSSQVHTDVQAAVLSCTAAVCPQVAVAMEPYVPNYFLINGRSMPDLMDVPYSPAYPNQPYNGNPHMHPGEKMLMRVVGQGRLQHPFHFHGNHARVLARDANLLVSASDRASLAGPLLFTIPTVSGQTVDAIFTWTGKGLNWDVYNHSKGDGAHCTPDVSGYHSVKTDPNYGEWCADHNKPIPVTPPDPQIVANGQWYGGTPYLGLSGVINTVDLPPGTLNQNPTAGYAYMWHSHNEREITTNDVFPGGLMMMMIIDPPQAPIDETK